MIIVGSFDFLSFSFLFYSLVYCEVEAGQLSKAGKSLLLVFLLVVTC